MPENRFHHITRKCFVNAPFDMLKADLLDYFIENAIQPEIGLDGDVLLKYSLADFAQVAASFQRAGLPCTIHAPFHGLSLGCADGETRRRSFEMLRLAFELIPVFQPRSIVCHLNFKEEEDGERRDEWHALSLSLWRELLAASAKYETAVMFENTYEKNPAPHRRFFEELQWQRAGFCLDTGHVMAFAKNTWHDWLPALEPWLGQLHLHDNLGTGDDHLAVGAGIFDFGSLFSYLRQRELHPIVTLEPHQKEYLWQSLAYLDKFGYLDSFPP